MPEAPAAPRALCRNGTTDSQSSSEQELPSPFWPLHAHPPQQRLVDATRDPAINGGFRRALEDKTSVEVRVEMADFEGRSFQLNVAPLGPNLAVGVFFDITLERLEPSAESSLESVPGLRRRSPLFCLSATRLVGRNGCPENNTIRPRRFIARARMNDDLGYLRPLGHRIREAAAPDRSG